MLNRRRSLAYIQTARANDSDQLIPRAPHSARPIMTTTPQTSPRKHRGTPGETIIQSSPPAALNFAHLNTVTIESPLSSASSSSSNSSLETLVEHDTFVFKQGSMFGHNPAKQVEPIKMAWSSPSDEHSRSGGRRNWIIGIALLACASALYSQRQRLPAIIDTSPIAPVATRIETCNPFGKAGFLHVNASSPTDNFWLPYDTTCGVESLVDAVRTTMPSAPANTKAIDLDWLHDRTIVLIGDSVDRNHLQQFCELVEGKQELIGTQHGLSPAPFRNGKDELYKTSGDHNEWQSRPWTCHVERYNLFLVNLFHYGLVTPQEYGPKWFAGDAHYYAPFGLPDRIEHIVQPILDNYHRAAPDLVSFNTAFWDAAYILRSQEGSGYNYEVSSIPINYITKYAQRLAQAFEQVSSSRTFAKTKTILWRTAHEPNYYMGVPGDIVIALNNAARQVIRSIQQPSAADGSLLWNAKSPTRQGLRTSPSNLASKLRVDHSGDMMTGQRQHLHDGLHPKVLPNGKIWADIMLHELRRAVQS